MSNVFYYLTIILSLIGVVYSLLYIWLNSFSKIVDIETRNASILRILRAARNLSLVLPLIMCLLSDPRNIDYAIKCASSLSLLIAISWLVVILGCGISLMISFVSKSKLREGSMKSTKRLYSTAIPGVLIGFILSWLLS